jgi:hypothetical protein
LTSAGGLSAPWILLSTLLMEASTDWRLASSEEAEPPAAGLLVAEGVTDGCVAVAAGLAVPAGVAVTEGFLVGVTCGEAVAEVPTGVVEVCCLYRKTARSTTTRATPEST